MNDAVSVLRLRPRFGLRRALVFAPVFALVWLSGGGARLSAQGEVSHNVAAPEALERNVDSLLNVWRCVECPPVDTAFHSSRYNPIASDEEYIARLQRLPAIVELPYNAQVRQVIDMYCTERRSTVSYMLGAANLYFPIFEEALETYGLPLELKYLPIVESALDPTARSRAGAVGLWQFTLPTARQYGLEVNSLVDERCDIEKASRAAARYLSDLSRLFGDWTLAIAAYNCGPGNVSKAIHRAGGERDYWEIYPYLPKETRGYVPAFIAVNYVMAYYCLHGIAPMRTAYTVPTDTIHIDRDLHFRQVSDLCGISMEALHALNPQYRTDLVPGSAGTATLRLPVEQVVEFIDWGDSIYHYQASDLLRRRSAVTPREAAPKTSASSSSQEAKYHTVKRGDTLGALAKRYGTTVARLRALNGLRGNNIVAGKRLRVR